MRKAKEQLELYPALHGFDSVRNIEQAYREAKRDYQAQLEKQEEYNRYIAEAKRRKKQNNHADNKQEKRTLEISLTTKPVDKKEAAQRMDRPDFITPEEREENTSGVNRVKAHYGKNGKRRESILKNLAQKQEQVDRRNEANRSQTRNNNRRRGGPEL